MLLSKSRCVICSTSSGGSKTSQPPQLQRNVHGFQLQPELVVSDRSEKFPQQSFLKSKHSPTEMESPFSGLIERESYCIINELSHFSMRGMYIIRQGTSCFRLGLFLARRVLQLSIGGEGEEPAGQSTAESRHKKMNPPSWASRATLLHCKSHATAWAQVGRDFSVSTVFQQQCIQ